MKDGTVTSVIVADDHPLVLRGIRDLIAATPDFDIIAVATDGVTALEQIRALTPRIAVLDLAMAGMRGTQVLQAVAREGLPVRVVFLTASISPEETLEAVAAGAYGIQLKESASEDLVECLRNVASGRRAIPANLLETAITEQSIRRKAQSDESAQLTAREAEIARLVTAGLPNKEIARRLDVTEGTVKIHLHNIFRKLQVPNRTSLAGIALRWRQD
jgi:DNA-binding NarL/FixJ family response regulator